MVFGTTNGNSHFFTVLVSKKWQFPVYFTICLEFSIFKGKIQAGEFPNFHLKICMSSLGGCL